MGVSKGRYAGWETQTVVCGLISSFSASVFVMPPTLPPTNLVVKERTIAPPLPGSPAVQGASAARPGARAIAGLWTTAATG
ncbi:hypothetical protein GCM10020358_77780 [Amorphoplanes nipponensis]|uniref:Uncharacterized protein n=1 Tax=Actinoplanes nipponensis TaxID=135950 RepID=A0A919JNY2_9ACTN|nr:hypothetical protein Ani05nite_62560 [Actinoplanes nipponensis]